MSNWAELPRNIIIDIDERLTEIEYHEAFVGVCKSWRAAAFTKDKKYLKHKTFGNPWLMLAEENDDEEEKVPRGFFSLSSGKICKILLPEVSKTRCFSCQDWLFMVAKDNISVSLLHPISRVQIHLPQLNTFPRYKSCSVTLKYKFDFVKKVLLSANPNSTSDFIVFVIWGCLFQLGYWKSGDTSWTETENWHVGYHDIIYYNNKLYALDYRSKVVICDVHGPNPTKLHQLFALPILMVPKVYLVEVSKKILLVDRDVQNFNRAKGLRTWRIMLFELDLNDGKQLEFGNLGNKALFLGNNSTFFVECSKFNNCKPNCIYFSDDYYDYYMTLPQGGGKDTGIYSLSDGSIEPLINDIGCNRVTPPLWIGPGF